MSLLKIKDANGNWQDVPSIKGADGIDGTNGVDGFSPTASVSKNGNVATISITDKNGTTTATISDGVDGINGTNGRDGVVQYTAGDNITIDENNVISATGGLTNYLGYIEDYTSSNRLDITNLEKGTYALAIRSNRLHPTVYLKVVYNNQDKTFDKEVDVDGAVISDMFYFEIKNPIKTLSGYDEALRICFLDINSSTSQIIYKKYGINYNSATGTLSNGSYYNTTINAVATDTTQTISGKKTFSTLPESSVVPTSDNQLVNKKYVDDNAGGSGIAYITLTGEYNFTSANTTKNLSDADATAIKDFINSTGVTNANSTNSVKLLDCFYRNKYAGNMPLYPFQSGVASTNIGGNQGDAYTINCFTISPDTGRMDGNGNDTQLQIVTIYIVLDVTTREVLMKRLSWDRWKGYLSKTNTTSYTPSQNYHPATKKYVDDKLTSLTGYDATKTQILKNIQGTLTWIDE